MRLYLPPRWLRHPTGQGSGPVRASFVSQDPEWSFAKGCFWTVTYQVYNAGDQPEENVILHIELVDTGSNAVRDTRSVYVGTLEPGASTTVVSELDGECTSEYVVRAIPSFG